MFYPPPRRHWPESGRMRFFIKAEVCAVHLAPLGLSQDATGERDFSMWRHSAT
jgi:hypothetical protein